MKTTTLKTSISVLMSLVLAVTFTLTACNSATDDGTKTPGDTNPFLGTWKPVAVTNLPPGACDPVGPTSYIAYTFYADGTGYEIDYNYNFTYSILSDTEIKFSQIGAVCGISSSTYLYEFTSDTELILTQSGLPASDAMSLTLAKQ